jgi:hypothetical protein
VGWKKESLCDKSQSEKSLLLWHTARAVAGETDVWGVSASGLVGVAWSGLWANLQKRWGHVLTDPARSVREAPRAKRALRKMFGISMPSRPCTLIPC